MKLVLTSAFILSFSTTVFLVLNEVEANDLTNREVPIQIQPSNNIDDGLDTNYRHITKSGYVPVKGKTVLRFSGSDRTYKQPEIGDSQVMIIELLNFDIRN